MIPYLSFVIAARNDNYGGNFLHRISVFLNALLSLWDKYNVSAELIIVEWNPPKDKKRLRDVLSWPKYLKPGSVCILEVPAEIHYRLPMSDLMPMFEYIAKNVGIRRARGQYILATNPDLLYSEELVSFLSTQSLSRDCFYRVDRYDIAESVPIDLSVEEQLRFCAKHLFRVSNINGTFLIRGFQASLRRLLYRFTELQKARILCHERGIVSLRQLHTNASGDFLLMEKSRWFEIKGYPELKSHSFIDGYGCILAASLGLRQILLPDPMRIYHQEHDRGEHGTRPHTDYQRYLQDGEKMLRYGKPEILNDDNWGIGEEDLSTHWIT